MVRFFLFIAAIFLAILYSYWMPWLIPYPMILAASLPLGTLLMVFYLSTPIKSLYWLAGLGLGLDIFNAPAQPHHLAHLAVAWFLLTICSLWLSGASWWQRTGAGMLAASAGYLIAKFALSFSTLSPLPPSELWRLAVLSVAGHAAGAFLLIGCIHAIRMRLRGQV